MTETLTFIIYLICPSEIYKWVAGRWKACSSLCDGGIRYRDVDCYAVFEVTMVPDYPVYDYKCSKEEKVGRKILKIKTKIFENYLFLKFILLKKTKHLCKCQSRDIYQIPHINQNVENPKKRKTTLFH